MSRLVFFRQSSWIMLSTLANGVLMYAVHIVASRMPKSAYGVFATLLQVIVIMAIPTGGLQGVVACKTAASVNLENETELNGMVRYLLKAIFLAWLVGAVFLGLFQQTILAALKITSPEILWLTAVIGLASLWRPVLMGVVQGQEQFAAFGWAKISEGLVRFLAVCIGVGLLGGLALSATASVLCGVLAALAVSVSLSWRTLSGPGKTPAARKLFGYVIPLSLGLGIGTFMISADMVFVQIFFKGEETGFYAAAAMTGRGLSFITSAISIAMFPKLARSNATGEPSDALRLALYTTLFSGVIMAVACTLFPAGLLRLIYDKSFLPVSAPLVPWFAWAMLPLTVANILINGLMARACFAAVPWLLVVAAGYGVTLYFRHETFQQVIQALGVFGSLLFLVCAWFVWGPGVTDTSAKTPKSTAQNLP